MQKKLLQTLLMAAILTPGVGMAADTIGTIKQSSNQAITSTILAQSNACGCLKCTVCDMDQTCFCLAGCSCSKEESKASPQKS